MKHIPLAPSVYRCRPSSGMQKLLNDCNHEDACARRLAANINGSPQEDLSVYGTTYGNFVVCRFFVPIPGCENHRDPVIAKSFSDNVKP